MENKVWAYVASPYTLGDKKQNQENPKYCSFRRTDNMGAPFDVIFVPSSCIECPDQENWVVTTTSNAYDESFPKDQIVYLSAEADDELEVLDPSKVYVVGGLIDKNRHKGLCHHRATTRGIATARLPIGKFLEGQTRKVLTINHVVEIMSKMLDGNHDWASALEEVIPSRKGFQKKVDHSNHNALIITDGVQQEPSSHQHSMEASQHT